MKDAIDRIVKDKTSSALMGLVHRVDGIESDHSLQSKVLVMKEDDLRAAAPNTDSLTFFSSFGKQPPRTELSLDAYSQLVELVTGDDCLESLDFLVLDGFDVLKKLAIGDRCCTKGNGVLMVANCNHLSSITCGNYSFTNYETCYLIDCRNLLTVRFGRNCFVPSKRVVFESCGLGEG